MPGQKHDREDRIHSSQEVLQFQPAQTRHSYVQQYAARFFSPRTLKKFVARLVEDDLIAGGAQQPPDRGAKRRIVIDNVQDGRRNSHAGASMSGRMKRNTTPPPARFSAQILPP